jgi:molybdenum cofactor biosynthesis protein B
MPDDTRSTPAQHKAAAPSSVTCYVLTVSDSRTEGTDTGGQLIRDLLTGAGHQVLGHAIVKDDPHAVALHIEGQLLTPDLSVIITTGGTGITSRDGTFEAVDSLIEKRLEGFGELFRMLSYQEIGSAAMMSRATAGTARRSLDVPSPAGPKAIFVLPGSPDAVRLAMTKLVLPELGHVVQQISR